MMRCLFFPWCEIQEGLSLLFLTLWDWKHVFLSEEAVAVRAQSYNSLDCNKTESSKTRPTNPTVAVVLTELPTLPLHTGVPYTFSEASFNKHPKTTWPTQLCFLIFLSAEKPQEGLK